MSEPPHIPPPPNSISPVAQPQAPLKSRFSTWADSSSLLPPDGGRTSLPSSPEVPLQLRIQRIMLFLMPAWTVLMLPSLIWWENIHLFGAWDVLLAVWLVLPGAAAMACGLLMGRGGRAVLYAIAGLCVTIVVLNFWFFLFGGPPVLRNRSNTTSAAVRMPGSTNMARMPCVSPRRNVHASARIS